MDKFPELSDEENGVIQIARGRGFARYWPAFPSATAQAQNTFKSALAWLQSAPPEGCPSCVSGVAHDHGAESSAASIKKD